MLITSLSFFYFCVPPSSSLPSYNLRLKFPYCRSFSLFVSLTTKFLVRFFSLKKHIILKFFGMHIAAASCLTLYSIYTSSCSAVVLVQSTAGQWHIVLIHLLQFILFVCPPIPVAFYWKNVHLMASLNYWGPLNNSLSVLADADTNFEAVTRNDFNTNFIVFYDIVSGKSTSLMPLPLSSNSPKYHLLSIKSKQI